jgi:penicillin-binding protein 1C
VSLALGSAETRLVDLAEAYAVLARGGDHRGARLVLPRAGDRDPRPTNRVLSEEAAYLTSRMLADARARRRTFGVETPLELPFEVAVKTGTSQGHQDNVVVGYTPQVVVAVWAGNFSGAPTHEVLAMDGAAPLFRDTMLVATQYVEAQHVDGSRTERAVGHGNTDAHARFVRPAGVVEREVCALSGLLRGAHCPHAAHEEMARAHVPTRECSWHGPGGVALPAEVSAWQRGGASLPAADGDARVEILGPANDARFVIDPTTPRSVQAAHLRVAVRAADVPAVRWEVDGALLADARAPYDASLPLVPGTHRVRAVLPDGATDEIVLHVVDGAHR